MNLNAAAGMVDGDSYMITNNSGVQVRIAKLSAPPASPPRGYHPIPPNGGSIGVRAEARYIEYIWVPRGTGEISISDWG